MEQNKKYYIVKVGESWNYATYDWTNYIFDTLKEAEDYFDQMKEEKIQQVIDDNEMSEEEAEDYRQEVADNTTCNYCEDPESEWAVSIEEAYYSSDK